MDAAFFVAEKWAFHVTPDGARPTFVAGSLGTLLDALGKTFKRRKRLVDRRGNSSGQITGDAMLCQELFHASEPAVIGVHDVGADGAMNVQIEHAGSEQPARKIVPLGFLRDFNGSPRAYFFDYAVTDDDDSVLNAFERSQRRGGGQGSLHRELL